MKKVCGYKSLNGKFYELESECEKADLEFKVKEAERYLNNFYSDLNHLFNSIELDYRVNFEELTQLIYFRKTIEEKVCRLIFHHSDDFLKIIKEKEELKNNLDKLENEHRIKNSWWYKFFIQ